MRQHHRARRGRETIDRSYLCRVLRLTLLAPEIVEAIWDGLQPVGVSLPALMKAVPVEWERSEPGAPLERSLSAIIGFTLERFQTPEDWVEPIPDVPSRAVCRQPSIRSASPLGSGEQFRVVDPGART